MKARLSLALIISISSTFLLASIALAILDNGAINGEDTASWGGNDNPDGVTGSYAYYNYIHDVQLKEWAEPEHDHMRDRDIEWSDAAETKLDNEADTRYLVIEQRIHDQYFYNGASCCFSTNLPYSSYPEFECCYEEFIQRYSEADMEIRNPARILQDTTYFYDLMWDSEKPSETNKPLFYSEVEWELQTGGDIRFDVTGLMFKWQRQQ